MTAGSSQVNGLPPRRAARTVMAASVRGHRAREGPPATVRSADGNRGGHTGVSRAGPHTRARRGAGFFGQAATAVRGRRPGASGAVRTSGLGLRLRSVSMGNGAHAKSIAGAGCDRSVSFRGLSRTGRAGPGRSAAGIVSLGTGCSRRDGCLSSLPGWAGTTWSGRFGRRSTLIKRLWASRTCLTA